MTEEIKEKLKLLQKGSKELVGLLTKYEKLKEGGVMNAYKLGEILPKLERSLALYPIEGIKEKIKEWIDGEWLFVKKLKEEFALQFANELSALLKTKGFSLKGQYPILYSGLYSIKLEFSLGRVRIEWGPEPVGTTKPSPKDVVELIDRFEKTLKQRPFDPNEFASKLFEAYKRRLRIEGKGEGEKVLLVDLLTELVFLQQPRAFRVDPTKRNFKEYGRCMFGYDLYRLKKTGLKRSIRLYTATFDATRFKDKVIFVPEGEGGTRYGYISFER